MIINENSWHVKFHDFFYDKYHRPHSLCAYFWKMVWAFSVTLFIISLLAIGCSVMGAAILTKFFTLGTVASLTYGFFLGTTIATVSTAAVIGLIIGVVHLQAKFELSREEKHWKRLELIKQGIQPKTNFMVEYIKARKEKVCPTIEFKAKQ